MSRDFHNNPAAIAYGSVLPGARTSSSSIAASAIQPAAPSPSSSIPPTSPNLKSQISNLKSPAAPSLSSSMPSISSISSIPSTQSTSPNLKSQISNLKSPYPQSFSEIDALSTHAERRLKSWFAAVPDPSIEQLAHASQAIWRLTSVRKTLILAASPNFQARSGRRAKAAINTALSEAMRELEAEMARFMPIFNELKLGARTSPSAIPAPAIQPAAPSPSLGAQTPSSASPASHPVIPSPSSSMPSISSAPSTSPNFKSQISNLKSPSRAFRGSLHVPEIPFWRPRTPRSPASHGPNPNSPSNIEHLSLNPNPQSSSPHSAFGFPHSSIPSCPSLRAPLNTAQAASRQVESLCKSADLPLGQRTSPSTPAPAGQPVSPSSSSSTPPTPRSAPPSPHFPHAHLNAHPAP